MNTWFRKRVFHMGGCARRDWPRFLVRRKAVDSGCQVGRIGSGNCGLQALRVAFIEWRTRPQPR